MTKLPANLNDPSLQVHLKNMDIRRISTAELSDTGFYQALLATAPLQTLGSISSTWSLQHLSPATPKAESYRRSEVSTRTESTTSDSLDREVDEETPRRPIATDSTRLNQDSRSNVRNVDVIPKLGANQELNLGAPIGIRVQAFTEAELESNETALLSRLLAGQRNAEPVQVDIDKLLEVPAVTGELESQQETQALVAAQVTQLPHWPPIKEAFFHEPAQLAPALGSDGVQSQSTESTDFLSPAIRSEGFPTAAEVVRRVLAQSATGNDDTTAGKVIASTEGSVKLDRGLWGAPISEDEQTKLAVSLAGRVERLVTPDSRKWSEGLSSSDRVLAEDNLTAVDVDSLETVEISFKPDAGVLQRSGRQGPRELRRGLGRSENNESSIGSRPGSLDSVPNLYQRPDKFSSIRVTPESSPTLSLDEIPVLPNAQKLALAAGTRQDGTTTVTGPTVPNIALELPGQLDNVTSAFLRDQSSTASHTNVVAANPALPAAGAVAIRSEGVAPSGEIEASLPVPSRLLNQVSQALKQVPAGDSTMRLQLNPVELGQLMIEISFRDGVMHGKLRAEQAPTLKLLQDGLDGLRSRLNEQGIVVQTLEVELGQQGDFSHDQQQQRSFGQSQEFGQKRHSNGYFSNDGPPARRTAPQAETVSQPTNRNHDGRWAVNVIV
ncbi:MAG: flagellar hook-length control protein FliK [Planctomycetaceae bacterium]|nr:flagellar hook-length control protein FliK [Planctomycetaceae bacterium]